MFESECVLMGLALLFHVSSFCAHDGSEMEIVRK